MRTHAVVFEVSISQTSTNEGTFAGLMPLEDVSPLALSDGEIALLQESIDSIRTQEEVPGSGRIAIVYRFISTDNEPIFVEPALCSVVD